MPLCHVAGIHMLTAAFILKGLPIVLERTFSVEETLLLIQRERPTVLNILMAPLQLLLTSPELPQGDASSLRLVLTAAAKYTREFCLEVIYKLGLDQLIFGYGLTEASPTVTLTESTAETIWKENSIGWPVWINEVRVVDAASEQTVPVGSVGELLVRGPNVFSGYFGQPEQTAQALRDGWLWTGDYVREDEEGCLFFVDRRTDMVKTGGENVSATEVEVAILHCNGTLADAVVVGMPDPVWGEAITAFCVVKPGQNTSEDEIRANLRGHLASYKIPKAVYFVQDLPRSISVKVQKHILRQQLSDGTVSTPFRTDDNSTLS
jgi:fatty-acyl-CoA synthase